MTDSPSPHELEIDEAIAHRWDSSTALDLFEVNSGYGNGEPRYHVCLDAGGQSWWFDPDQAIRLGKRLAELGSQCERQNAEEAERRSALNEKGSTE